MNPKVSCSMVLRSFRLMIISFHHDDHEGHEGFKRSCSDFVLFAFFLENTCAAMIRAMNWHEVSVIPAKAGIHPLPPLDAGLRRHDESRIKTRGGGIVAISYTVDELKFMNTSWCNFLILFSCSCAASGIRLFIVAVDGPNIVEQFHAAKRRFVGLLLQAPASEDSARRSLRRGCCDLRPLPNGR